ncbi:MAG: DUF3050 domain-containing protein [Hyphomicrobiales bacterium]|nr:DUF3050 domain-containing protein [Hyphomicrobiales bacterium]MCP5373285.1 DUF3050 domain-containing protein [Hyphomicrobiales bacterium]
MTDFPLDRIAAHRARLEAHPVYGAVRGVDDLRVFMEHHVYSVWDFMSLIKFLQAELAPARVPWTPVGDPLVRRFVNELVLEEESDERVAGVEGLPEFLSHFELYTHAMGEVGADPEPVRAFVALARDEGIDAALAAGLAPPPSAAFTGRTFAFLAGGRAHEVAAALALGREHIIPGMFRAFLGRMGLDEAAAPVFHGYLKRHIHLDEDFHGPLSLRMVEVLVAGDPARREQAVAAAIAAIEARLAFWDGVLERLPSRA